MRIITLQHIKTKGFLKLLRELNGYLFNGILSTDEFGLFMALVMNADWDKRHRNVGRVCISNNTLGKIRGLNRAKVADLKKSLVKKGFIQIVGEENSVDIILISSFEKYLLNTDFGYSKIFKELEGPENQLT
jgi:hypothetical protein